MILSPLASSLLAPAAGGGQPVTLKGVGLNEASGLTVGAVRVPITSKTATSITFTWPANAASSTAYDITVTGLPNKTYTLRHAVFYLPASVKNAWYAQDQFFDAEDGIWTDLIGGVELKPFSTFTAPTLSPWVNGKAMFFSGTNGLQNVSAPTQTQPGAIFVVGQTGDVDANNTYFAGGTLANSWIGYQTGAGSNGSPTANAGTDLSDVTDVITKPSFVEYVFNGGSGSISVNNGTKTIGAVGAKNLVGITLGGIDTTQPLTDGYEALVLLYNGVPSGGDELILYGIATALFAPIHINLAYTITPVDPVTQAQLNTAVAAVDLQLDGIQQKTGCVLVSDTTTNVGGNVQRVVVFELTPKFRSNFTTLNRTDAIASGSWASPFYNLYTHRLGGELGSAVSAAPPTIVQTF